MFEKKKIILFITKSKITVFRVVINNKPNQKIIGQFDFTLPLLDQILLKIKRIGNNNIRILLSEEFVYVTSLSFFSDSILNKTIVEQKAQEVIPEDLKQTIWDFKQITNLPFSSSHSQTNIQVIAAVKTLFEPLNNSIIKTGLRVEAIEPLSYALARFTKNQEKPFLFAYVSDYLFLTFAQKEIVFATERLNHIDATSINQFIAFVKENFSIEIKNIVFCGNIKNIDAKQFINTGLEAEVQNISPVISLAYKQDIKGRDKDVLNLYSF